MRSARSTGWSSSSTVPLSTRLQALILCSILLLPVCACGQTLAVRTAGTGLVETEPAGTATASFFVSNEGDRVVDVGERLDLPDGWTPITSAPSFKLAPGETQLRVLGFYVPLAMAAGSYSLAYEAAAGDGSARGRAEARVIVLPVAGLLIAERDVPDRVIAGETLRSRFTIANHGNLPATILVRARSSESFPVRPDTTRFRVEAGASRDVEIEVETPPRMDRTTEHVLKVEAVSRASDGEEVTARSTTFQTVIALARGGYDPYHRVPCRLSIGYAGGEGGAGTQVEYSGHGRLTDSGTSEVDFLLRGPNVRDESAFGLRDEYRLKLSGETYRLRAGDVAYNLSSLTVRHRYGRGVGGELEAGRWTLGGWRSRSVWGEPRIDDSAAYVRYRRTERVAMGINYLRKHYGGPSDVLSVTAEVQPLPSVNVDLEYARNLEGVGGSHRAYRARLRGTTGDVRYFAERIRGGEDYVGLHRHEVQTVASVSLPVFLGLRIHGLHRDYEEGRDRMADYVSWTRERVSSAGLKRALPFGIRATADWRDVARRGQTGSTLYDYETQTIRVGLERAHPMFSTWGFIETGVLDNRIESSEYSATRYGFRVSCRLGSRCRASGHFQSALPGSGDPTMRNDVAGVHLTFRPIDDLELDAGFQRKGYSAEDDADVEELTTGGRYTLPSGHCISGRLRWTRRSDDDGQAVFRVAYDIPVGMRASRKKTSGSLAGTVFDAEDPAHPGLEGVVLILDGVAAITDRRGRFSFPEIEPGDYYLMIDRASIGLRRVATAALPLRVAVAGGRQQSVDLGVAAPGRIDGSVVLDDSSGAPVVDRETAAAHVSSRLPVKLVGEEETLRCATDARGRFSFEDVRPGRWILKIGSQGVPPLHELKQSTFFVEVVPGATSRVSATMVPVVRTIPIIETGNFRVSGRAP